MYYDAIFPFHRRKTVQIQILAGGTCTTTVRVGYTLLFNKRM